MSSWPCSNAMLSRSARRAASRDGAQDGPEPGQMANDEVPNAAVAQQREVEQVLRARPQTVVRKLLTLFVD